MSERRTNTQILTKGTMGMNMSTYLSQCLPEIEQNGKSKAKYTKGEKKVTLRFRKKSTGIEVQKTTSVRGIFLATSHFLIH